jgi:5'-nucleotidase
MKRALVSLGVLVFALMLSNACGRDQRSSATESSARTNSGPPRILVTNDDGYATEGIAAMANELAKFADVVVVAPRENESGSSQSARLYWSQDGIRVYEVAIGERLTGYAIDGTPTDCVFLGLKIFGKEKPFDLVVSGINHGANIGIAYYYSGTVGAAFEALVNGVPAIAVSQSGGREDVETAATFASRVVRKVLAQPLDEGVLLSINVPDSEIGCVVAVPPGDYPWDVALQPSENSDGDTVFKGERVKRGEQEPGYDVRAYLDGCITVTPFQLDRTHHPTLETIAGWEPGLESLLD